MEDTKSSGSSCNSGSRKGLGDTDDSYPGTRFVVADRSLCMLKLKIQVPRIITETVTVEVPFRDIQVPSRLVTHRLCSILTAQRLHWDLIIESSPENGAKNYGGPKTKGGRGRCHGVPPNHPFAIFQSPLTHEYDSCSSRSKSMSMKTFLQNRRSQYRCSAPASDWAWKSTARQLPPPPESPLQPAPWSELELAS